MTRRYIDTPLTDLDTPEPTPTPRTLTPRYIEVDAETPAPRQQIPDTAYGLPAYQSTLPPPDPLLSRLVEPDGDLELLRQAFTHWTDALRPGLTKFGENLPRISARSAPPPGPTTGDLPVDTSPDDPRARALWLRQHRNTGPTRDLTHQRRPRQHPGGPR
jgi:hypothetical protein